MSKIYFSIREANDLARKLKKDIERLMETNEELSMLDNTKIEFDEENMENFLLEVALNKTFHEKNLELYSLLEYLIKQGCVVRDLETMEIDFYSKFEDKEILLCWRPSEEKIAFWHYPGEDIAKRKPLKLVEQAYFEQLNRMK